MSEKHSFGFKKIRKTSLWSFVNGGFVVFTILGFLLFSLITRVQSTVQAAPAETLFEQNMDELALYVSTYDTRASSVLLSIQRIAKGYSNENFLQTYKGDIENVLQYISNNPDTFSQMGLQEYAPFLTFISSLSTYKEDIFSLMGAEKDQTYIIALQNTAEKRPNGGFFGSFVKITLRDAKVKDLQFIDSYVPGILKPNITLQAPEWAETFLSDDKTITFLASNKFGFTDMDGKNIKKLYDLTYNDDIRGVFFVQSKLFADLLPGFQEQLREWQFKNAAIDLIRGEALPNKKELYFNGANAFLQEHKSELIKSIAKHFDMLQTNNYIQGYLVRTSKELNPFLQQQGLQTVFDHNHMYFWDYNSSYNKIDTFIHKAITIVNEQGKIVVDSALDVVDTSKLTAGKYSIHIQYSLSIPDSYIALIEGFAKQFDIKLNVREKHILAIYPERSTRGVVYMPQNVSVQSITGPVKTQSTFTTPFSNNAFYVVENTTNNSIKEVVVNIEVK